MGKMEKMWLSHAQMCWYARRRPWHERTLEVGVGAEVAAFGLLEVAAKGTRVQPEHRWTEKFRQRDLKSERRYGVTCEMGRRYR